MEKKYLARKYWIDKQTPMGKVDELAKEFKDVINLSLGDPDLNTDQVIINEAFNDAKKGHTKYTDFRGDPELRKQIRMLYKEEFNMDVQDEEVFITASGCLAMYLALEAIVDDGDEIILQAPHFTPYPQQVELVRGIPVELPTFEEENFQINVERLESLITNKTKALIINTPNNPTGSCFDMNTMKDIALVAEKYDLLVIADDIYTTLSYGDPFVPLCSIHNMQKQTITINSFSKDYTMTGWRVGNIIAPDFIIKTIQQINENVVFTAPAISQRAAIAALINRKLIQPPVIEEYRARTFYAAERVNNIPNMSVVYPPKGTFYLFINIKKTGLSSKEVSEAILRQAHVLTIPGISFGECGEGYIRIACTVDRNQIQEAFNRVEQMNIFSIKK